MDSLGIKLSKVTILGILIIFSILQALYNALLPIYLDEAYYWVWALRPEFSYYDHPGMVAWIIYPFTFIANNEFTIRLSTVIAMSVTVWYLVKVCLEAFQNQKEADTAWYVFFIFIANPAVHMGYVFITPDSPLMMFWAAGLYYTFMALKYGRTKDFIISGFLVGAMMLSKYAGVLFPVAVFIYILVCRRDVLKDYRLWLSLVIAILCLFPIVYWNYQHDWISIKFQYEHGTSEGFTFAGWDFILFILGSLFVIPTPVFGYVFLKYLWLKDYLRNKEVLFFVFLALVPMLFFFYKGFFKKMELNWIIPAFISSIVLIGYAIAKYNMKKTFKYGIIFSVVLVIILKFAPVLPFPAHLNIAERLIGYKEAIVQFEKYVKEGDLIFSDHLTTASMLTFYLPDHPLTHINVPSRFSQYTIWDKADGIFNYDKEGVYFGKEDAFDFLKEKYSSVIPLEVIKVTPYNAFEKTFYVYRCIP